MDYRLLMHAFVIVWYLSTFLMSSLVEDHEPVTGVAVGDEAAAPPQLRGESKYLSFEGWNGGWNNRRMSLEVLYTLAYVTNRTLVLPPRTAAPMTQGKTLYEDFFCLHAMRKYVNVLTWEEFKPLAEALPKSKSAPAKPVDCKEKYSRPTPRTLCKLSAPARTKALQNDWTFNSIIFNVDGDATSEDFQQYRRNRQPVDYRSALDSEMWVHFPQNAFGLYYQMFYYRDAARREEVFRVVRDGLALKRDLVDPAQRIVDRIGTSFNAIHYRRADFEGQFDDALVSEEDVVKHYKKQFADDDRPVYLAAFTKDSASEKQRVEYIRQQLGRKVYLFSDFDAETNGLPDAFSGVVEMVVCSHARHFVGTKLSTFSAYITRLRGHRTEEGIDKQVYFTDTAYEPGEKLVEATPYSWNPKEQTRSRMGDFRGARALWAREYPEAWQLPSERFPPYRR